MNILNTLALESNKQIKINFKGGDLSSDAGLILIKEFAAKLGFCKCQYKNVQKEENINVQSTASSFCLLSFQDRALILQTIRRSLDRNNYGVMQ